MTSPRADIVDPDSPGFYHCISRCVRRAFICDIDIHAGRSLASLSTPEPARCPGDGWRARQRALIDRRIIPT